MTNRNPQGLTDDEALAEYMHMFPGDFDPETGLYADERHAADPSDLDAAWACRRYYDCTHPGPVPCNAYCLEELPPDRLAVGVCAKCEPIRRAMIAKFKRMSAVCLPHPDGQVEVLLYMPEDDREGPEAHR